MQNTAIFYPVFAMVFLIFIVFVIMFRVRKNQLVTNRIHPQKIASAAQSAAVFTDNRAADHYRNLFELPVLFYVWVLSCFVTNTVNPITVGLAWAFVAARYAQAYIALTHNKVLKRMWAFFAGVAALYAGWIYLAAQLLLK